VHVIRGFLDIQFHSVCSVNGGSTFLQNITDHPRNCTVSQHHDLTQCMCCMAMTLLPQQGVVMKTHNQPSGPEMIHPIYGSDPADGYGYTKGQYETDGS